MRDIISLLFSFDLARSLCFSTTSYNCTSHFALILFEMKTQSINLFSDLFLLAHRLVEFYPEWVISWFAVGSYYFLIGKQELSRRYLSRATQLDRVFGPSWLAYGHSFALENEHDQAIAAYFKVRFFQRLMENVYKMGTKKFETF